MGRKFTNKMAVLIGKEGAGNYGVPPTPYNNTNYKGVIVSSPSLKPSGETISRDFVRTSFTKTAPNVGRKLNEISFSTELKGSNNATNPESEFYLHSLFKACGLVAFSRSWYDSNGVVRGGALDKVYLIELANADNVSDLTLYENVWAVSDKIGTPVNMKAQVIGIARRKSSDADTLKNDVLVVAVETSSTLTANKTLGIYRDTANAPSATLVVSATGASVPVFWRGAAFMPTSTFQAMVDQSLTMHYQVDDIRHETPGSLGTFSMSLEDGSVPKLDFSFTGLWRDPADLAPISGITFPDWSPPSVCLSNLIIAEDGGPGVGLSDVFKPSFTSFSFDLGGVVTLIPDCNSAECSGEVGITDRDPKGGVNPLVDDLASFNPWSTWSKGDPKLMSFCIGYNTQGASGDRGNVVIFSAPEVLFTGNGYQDRSGMAAYDIALGFSGNEDDEFVFVFG